MNFLNLFRQFKNALLGDDLRRDLARHSQAADALDRAVKETLSK